MTTVRDELMERALAANETLIGQCNEFKRLADVAFDQRDAALRLLKLAVNFTEGLVKPHGLPTWVAQAKEMLPEDECCHFDSHGSEKGRNDGA